MIEVLGLGIAIVLAGYLFLPRAPRPVSLGDLRRYRRLSEEMRRNEIHPFE